MKRIIGIIAAVTLSIVAYAQPGTPARTLAFPPDSSGLYLLGVDTTSSAATHGRGKWLDSSYIANALGVNTGGGLYSSVTSGDTMGESTHKLVIPADDTLMWIMGGGLGISGNESLMMWSDSATTGDPTLRLGLHTATDWRLTANRFGGDFGFIEVGNSAIWSADQSLTMTTEDDLIMETTVAADMIIRTPLTLISQQQLAVGYGYLEASAVDGSNDDLGLIVAGYWTGAAAIGQEAYAADSSNWIGAGEGGAIFHADNYTFGQTGFGILELIGHSVKAPPAGTDDSLMTFDADGVWGARSQSTITGDTSILATQYWVTTNTGGGTDYNGNIYRQDSTVGTGRTATLTDSLMFDFNDGGKFELGYDIAGSQNVRLWESGSGSPAFIYWQNSTTGSTFLDGAFIGMNSSERLELYSENRILLTSDTEFQLDVLDINQSTGTAGQVLQSNGGSDAGVEWVDVSTLSGVGVYAQENNGTATQVDTLDFQTGLDVTFGSGDADITIDPSEFNIVTVDTSADYFIISDASDLGQGKRVDVGNLLKDYIDPPTTDTYASIEVNGVAQSTNAPTLDFSGTDFSLVESPTDNFDITIQSERIEDIAGGMFSGNTETLITATYQDVDGTIDLVVNDDLSLYDNATSGFIDGLRIEDGGVSTVDPASAINFNTGFDVANAGSGEATVTFDWSEIGTTASVESDDYFMMYDAGLATEQRIVRADMQTWIESFASGSNWTLSGTDLYPNSTSYFVGVGTTTPAHRLHVNETSGDCFIRVSGPGAGATDEVGIQFFDGGTQDAKIEFEDLDGSTNQMKINIEAEQIVTIQEDATTWSASDASVDINAGLIWSNITTATTNTTLDYGHHVIYCTSAVTLFLPTSSSTATLGMEYIVINNSGGTVTVDPGTTSEPCSTAGRDCIDWSSSNDTIPNTESRRYLLVATDGSGGYKWVSFN